MDGDFNPECYFCFGALRLATEQDVAAYLRTVSPQFQAALDAHGGVWWTCPHCGPASTQRWAEHELDEEGLEELDEEILEELGDLDEAEELELLERHAERIARGECDAVAKARPASEIRDLHPCDPVDPRSDPLDPFKEPGDPSNANSEFRARRSLH